MNRHSLRDRRGRFATAERVAAEQFDEFAQAAEFDAAIEDAMRLETSRPRRKRGRMTETPTVVHDA